MLFEHLLGRCIKTGDLTLIGANGEQWRFGDGNAPRATLRLHDKALHRKLARGPRLALGEAYMDASLTVEEGSLYDLMSIYGANIENFEALWLYALADRLGTAIRRMHQGNKVGQVQKNVSHHYDLSDDLYDLFLDGDRQYSCAYFKAPSDSLETAQDNKKRHIAAKLLLDRPGLKILDIGSGWGGLAFYLAQETDAHVTGVTLSTKQHQVSTARAASFGLSDQVDFHLKDYRHATGLYDRIVSVGMFEHVGAARYREFFTKVSDLLTNDGVMLLHTIGRSKPPGQSNPWLRKYIFPGGYTPALSEITAAVEKSGLWITDVEILRLHYAETLRHWHDRFQAQRDKAVEIYDERFCRMWEFYLVGCEISFRYLNQVVFQIQLAKHQNALPLTRDYMSPWKSDHALVDQAAD